MEQVMDTSFKNRERDRDCSLAFWLRLRVKTETEGEGGRETGNVSAPLPCLARRERWASAALLSWG